MLYARYEPLIFAVVIAATMLILVFTREPIQHELPRTQPACADAIAAPTDGNCLAYDREMLGRGYIHLPDGSYLLRKERPNRGV